VCSVRIHVCIHTYIILGGGEQDWATERRLYFQGAEGSYVSLCECVCVFIRVHVYIYTHIWYWGIASRTELLRGNYIFRVRKVHMCLYVCMCVYTYVYTHIDNIGGESARLSYWEATAFSGCTRFIYVFMCVCVCVHVCICTRIHS